MTRHETIDEIVTALRPYQNECGDYELPRDVLWTALNCVYAGGKVAQARSSLAEEYNGAAEAAGVQG